MLDFPVHPQHNALSRVETASETKRPSLKILNPVVPAASFVGLALSALSTKRLLMQRRGSRFSAGFTRSALRLTLPKRGIVKDILQEIDTFTDMHASEGRGDTVSLLIRCRLEIENLRDENLSLVKIAQAIKAKYAWIDEAEEMDRQSIERAIAEIMKK